MSALIPALIKLLMSRAKGGGGAGGAGGSAKPELSQLEKNDKYSTKAILGGDMTFGNDGDKVPKLPVQPTYGEITGGRRK